MYLPLALCSRYGSAQPSSRFRRMPCATSRAVSRKLPTRLALIASRRSGECSFLPPFSGIVSAVLLGLGRVMGETMVVLFCAGNRIAIPDFTEGLGRIFFQPVHTMTGIIAQEMGEVVAASIHYRALFIAGLVFVRHHPGDIFRRAENWCSAIACRSDKGCVPFILQQKEKRPSS